MRSVLPGCAFDKAGSGVAKYLCHPMCPFSSRAYTYILTSIVLREKNESPVRTGCSSSFLQGLSVCIKFGDRGLSL